MRNGLVAVRQVVAPVQDGQMGPIPDVPAGWSAAYEDAGWCTVRDPQGRAYACWLMWERAADHAGAWIVLHDDPARLQQLADASDTRWTFAELWADPGPEAAALRRRWRFWRVDGTELATGRVLVNERVELPVPLAADPRTVSLPVTVGGYQITSLRGPAFLRTMAGFTDQDDAE